MFTYFFDGAIIKDPVGAHMGKAHPSTLSASDQSAPFIPGGKKGTRWE